MCYCVILCIPDLICSSSPELARQVESAKLLEDKVRRAEAEAHDMEEAVQQAEQERRHLEEMARKEKQETEASRRKVKDMEEKARRMAAQAEAKSKEAETMKAEVSHKTPLVIYTCSCLSARGTEGKCSRDGCGD